MKKFDSMVYLLCSNSRTIYWILKKVGSKLIMITVLRSTSPGASTNPKNLDLYKNLNLINIEIGIGNWNMQWNGAVMSLHTSNERIRAGRRLAITGYKIPFISWTILNCTILPFPHDQLFIEKNVHKWNEDWMLTLAVKQSRLRARFLEAPKASTLWFFSQWFHQPWICCSAYSLSMVLVCGSSLNF